LPPSPAQAGRQPLIRSPLQPAGPIDQGASRFQNAAAAKPGPSESPFEDAPAPAPVAAGPAAISLSGTGRLVGRRPVSGHPEVPSPRDLADRSRPATPTRRPCARFAPD